MEENKKSSKFVCLRKEITQIKYVLNINSLFSNVIYKIQII